MTSPWKEAVGGATLLRPDMPSPAFICITRDGTEVVPLSQYDRTGDDDVLLPGMIELVSILIHDAELSSWTFAGWFHRDGRICPCPYCHHGRTPEQALRDGDVKLVLDTARDWAQALKC